MLEQPLNFCVCIHLFYSTLTGYHEIGKLCKMNRSDPTRRSLPAKLHNFGRRISGFFKGKGDDDTLVKETPLTTSSCSPSASAIDKRKHSPSLRSAHKGNKELRNRPEIERVLKRQSTVSADSGFSTGNLDIDNQSQSTLRMVSHISLDLDEIPEPITESDEDWLDSLEVSEELDTFVDPPEDLLLFVER